MPIFKYKAIDKDGSSKSGYLTAANPQDLEVRLGEIGMYLVSHQEMKQTSFSTQTKISLKELIVFCVHMESLEKAGVPILDSIADLRDTADTSAMKNLMTDVHESLVGGEMLSQALNKHPEVFDRMFVGLIGAGEKTGKLSEVFGHLITHLKWVELIRSKIKKALYYPTFLLLIIMLVITQMMVFVIPKLSDFLSNQGFELPWYTHFLIATSQFFVNYWYIVIITPFIIGFTIYFLRKVSYTVAYFFDRMFLKTPVLGDTIIKIEMSRFCRFFGISYRSGIDILESLDVAGEVISNRVLRVSIKEAKQQVIEGTPLTKALMNTGQFPSLVIRMFKVGEDSGGIDSALENVNFFYDKEVEDAVNGLIGTIQPALTLILGIVIMWITIAVFGPLYQSFSKIDF